MDRRRFLKALGALPFLRLPEAKQEGGVVDEPFIVGGEVFDYPMTAEQVAADYNDLTGCQWNGTAFPELKEPRLYINGERVRCSEITIHHNWPAGSYLDYPFEHREWGVSYRDLAGQEHMFYYVTATWGEDAVTGNEALYVETV